MITLYQAHTSTNSGKVRLVLEEKRIAYSEVNIDLAKGDQNRPDYLELNPAAVVPTLVHDGCVLTESTLINEYLEEVFPEPALLPGDPFARARARRWPKLIDEETHPATLSITYAIALAPAKAAKQSRRELEAELAAMTDTAKAGRLRALQFEGLGSEPFRFALRAVRTSLERFEAGLKESGGPWFMGGQYTLADAAVTPWMMRFDNFHFAPMWADKPHLSAWWQRAQQRRNFTGVVSRNIAPGALEARGKQAAKAWPRVKTIFESL